jgi:hypothetical protein
MKPAWTMIDWKAWRAEYEPNRATPNAVKEFSKRSDAFFRVRVIGIALNAVLNLQRRVN